MAALLVALALAAPAATDPACRAQARAAVKTTKVTIKSLAGDPMRVEPYYVAEAICFDFTGDGRRDIAFTVWSGGTAGDIAWVALVRGARGWNVAVTDSGYKLGLRRIERDVVVTRPIYRRTDANCCPTGGFDHYAYRWNGKRFAFVRKWHTKNPLRG